VGNQGELAARISAALDDIRQQMIAAGDDTHAQRVGGLIGKLAEPFAQVAFCGHFSAGKSTLVNRLCGSRLLPSNPIPTSANVVTIRHGEPKAVIRLARDGRRETRTVPLDELEAHCRDGEGVESIELYYPAALLEGGVALLDTPGIDSTDDAHKLATESALHLADVVCYVMDYNHVQSEINFEFAKRLADWGKPLVLIVSQVDKHREAELPFAAYRKSVETAFADWNLSPAAILYISNRQPDHPYDQFEALQALLAGIARMKEELSAYSVLSSARYLIAEHGRWLEARSEGERQRLIEAAGGEEAMTAVRAELDALRRELEELKRGPEELRLRLRRETQSLLDNANVMPAAVRDLAGAMLESRKPGFRAGLLFAGAKTAAEKANRMRRFVDELNNQAKAAAEWHLKAMLRQAAEQLDWRGDTVERELIDPVGFELTEAQAESLIKPGAVFGNEYTMTYSRDVAEAVKAGYRERAWAAIDRLAEAAAARAEAAASAAAEKLAALAEQARALDALEALDAERLGALARLEALLPETPPRPALPEVEAPDAAPAEAAQTAPVRAAVDLSAAVNAGAAAGPADRPRRSGVPAPGEGALGPQRRAAARLREAAALVGPHAPLKSAAQAMLAKAERLASGKFTIALFGAFSAGKSSLANALIGRRALPVSPNPTTAAINRIAAPEPGEPDGHARITMKTRVQMAADVRHSLTMLGLGEEAGSAAADDLDALLELAARITPDRLHPGGRPHYAFLKAARQGIASCGPLLGQQLRADAEAYRSYVADETLSCFVQEIDLYIDSPLTAQGIVLVDTPGADSVNARHTDVAFHYIKNADAILFVTYYNHAFSQADRRFLTQLGRVKDQFELDKMFFIVNAADLAADEAELKDVIAHVEANLLKHGIRHPRMFPVSSLAALDAKLRGEADESSGMPAFERALAGFAAGELGGMALEAADRELERAAGALKRWLDDSRQDEAVRRSRLETLKQRAADAADAVRAAAADAPFEPLRQELGELLHHVQRRVAFRFGEMFGLAFHPSALQDDGRDLKRALAACWEELRHALAVELRQELQATSLRMDNALRRLAARLYDAEASRLKAELEGFDPAPYEVEVQSAAPDDDGWTTDAVDMKRLWSLFKSPRKFFEQGGRDEMRAELERRLEPDIRRWMEERAAAWEAAYASAWRAAAEAAAERLAGEIGAFIGSSEAALAGAARPDELQALLERLEALRVDEGISITI
jgi:GTPase Era involved in 16S rRNA processing